MHLDRDVALVVVHHHHDVVLPVNRLVEDAVSGDRTTCVDCESDGISYRRRDLVLFGRADQSTVAAVRIDRGDGDSWVLESPVCEVSHG